LREGDRETDPVSVARKLASVPKVGESATETALVIPATS